MNPINAAELLAVAVINGRVDLRVAEIMNLIDAMAAALQVDKEAFRSLVESIVGLNKKPGA